MGHKLRIQSSVTSYLQACQVQGLRRAVQSVHAGMQDAELGTRLAAIFPNLNQDSVEELVRQAHNAIAGADELNQTLLTVPELKPSTWGYDPSLPDEWSIHFVYYTPAPTSWWTRMIEASGRQLPIPQDIIDSIVAIERLGGRPSMNRPYPENAVYTGLKEFMPIVSQAPVPGLGMLVDKAIRGEAPAWFQAAYNEAERLGIDLNEWGTNFSAIVAGVYRSIAPPQ